MSPSRHPFRRSPGAEPRLALLVALAQERRALQRCLTATRRESLGEWGLIVGRLEGRAVALLQIGPGADRARLALLALARRGPLRAAWSLGVAGGLAESLRPGDLVCPAGVLAADSGTGRGVGPAPAADPVWAALGDEGIPVNRGQLLTVQTPLRTPEAKRAARQQTGAVAVDMEAAGVATAAGELGLPWLALKAIVDPVGEPLPPFLAACTTPRGTLRWRGVLAALLAGPGQRETLRRLGRAMRLATRALQDGLRVALRAGAALTPSPPSSRM